MLTWNLEKKQQDRQDTVDQLLSAAYPYITNTTTDLNPKEFQVKLTSLIFIPEGEADLTSTLITEPDGTKESLYLWREMTRGVGLVYKMKLYHLKMKEDTDRPIQLTIQKKGQLVKANTGKLTLSDSLQNWLETHIAGEYISMASLLIHYITTGYWSPKILCKMAGLVKQGVVKEVEQMVLYDHTYTEEDD